jgi:hypothetical protein
MKENASTKSLKSLNMLWIQELTSRSQTFGKEVLRISQIWNHRKIIIKKKRRLSSNKTYFNHTEMSFRFWGPSLPIVRPCITYLLEQNSKVKELEWHLNRSKHSFKKGFLPRKILQSSKTAILLRNEMQLCLKHCKIRHKTREKVLEDTVEKVY